MKIITILTAAALGLTATASVAASTQTVSFADLDMSSAAGKTVLAQRIANAANTVCGVDNGSTDLASHVAAHSCKVRAVAAAMAGVAMKTAPQYASR